MREEDLADLIDYRNSSRFSDLEIAVLEYAEAMTGTPAVVPDEVFQRVIRHLDNGQMVELTAAIALQNFSARFNRAFDIPPENTPGTKED